MPRVEAVNVGEVRTVEWHGRVVTTGIWKSPVPGRVAVHRVNVDGDHQADLGVHGGPDKAVYAYASEDYAWWSRQLGDELAPGTFGENLTVSGLDLGEAVIGTRWRVGSALLAVAQPRMPCFKLGVRMGDAGFVDVFEAAGRFGAYLRVVEEGAVGAGDAIEVEHARVTGITVRELGRAQQDASPELWARVLADADVPRSWQDRARRGLDRAR